MNDEGKRIRLKVDPDGGIEIDAPVESYDQAVAGARSLTEGWRVPRNGPTTGNTGAQNSFASPPAPVERERVKTRNSKSSSSGARPGRIGSFEPQKDLLSEDQQIAIRQFAQKKRPVDQGDQVLVAMLQGEALLSRQGLSYNEIYTLMWRAGFDPLPKALDVVIQKLMQEQRVERGENGYFLKFLGQSRVENDLPGKSDS